MTRDWTIPDIDPPAYLLVGNEPNAPEPYGFTMLPNYAARHTLRLQEALPATFMIVGNVSYDNWNIEQGDGVWWIDKFLLYYKELAGKPFTQGIGVHSYASNADEALEQFIHYRGLYDGEMWLTECNLAQELGIDVGQFEKTLKAANLIFDRYACYTNRQDGSGSSLPFPMDLCSDEGLTPTGKVYKEL